MPNALNGKFITTGTLPGSAMKGNAEILRSQMRQETFVLYPIPMTSWRVFDAFQTNLPGTPATDDLGLVGGTFGSGSPTIQTEDLKAEGGNPTLNRARALFVLPPEYDLAETILIRAHAGMKTTVADDTATIDFEIYKSNLEEGIGSDLNETAALSINSTTLADKDFTITASGLAPGDVFDIRMTTTVSDGATGTAVIALIGQVYLVLDIRG